MKKQYVWEALYSDCIYESAATTISIHFTKDGAEEKIKQHKEATKKEHDKLWEDEEPPHKWYSGKYWGVNKMEVLP